MRDLVGLKDGRNVVEMLGILDGVQALHFKESVAVVGISRDIFHVFSWRLLSFFHFISCYIVGKIVSRAAK